MLFGSMACHAQHHQISDTTELISTTTINNGELAGKFSKQTGIHSFKGVPFAAPPLGPLRWQAPQAHADWEGVRQTTHFSDQCMQLPLFDDMVFRSSGISEDCLYLNVWTPNLKPAESLPVLLYLYGGGFHAGDGSEPRYDGEAMAKNDIVVITANYRLGVFGLLAHPELSAETQYKGSGNYTFMDQAAALQWAVDNVAAFGGDPTRITVGGESAGSLAVSGLMVSPLSKHNIAGAIGQSGSLLGNTLANVSLEQAEQQGEDLAAALGKQSQSKKPLSLKQLRELPAESLLTLAFEADYKWFMPTIDGYVFEELPYISYQKRKHARVPLLAGNNSQEQAFQSILGDVAPSIANYKSMLKALYPEQHKEVFALYPAKTVSQVKDAAQALAGDRWLAFSTWNWANLVAQTNPENVYYYQFSKLRPPSIEHPIDHNTGNNTGNRGAVHSAEIEYALGNLMTHPSYHWNEEDVHVSSIMHAYFANFIKTGNPNGLDVNENNLVFWPAMYGDEMYGDEMYGDQMFSNEVYSNKMHTKEMRTKQITKSELLNINTTTKVESLQQLNARYEFHRANYLAENNMRN